MDLSVRKRRKLFIVRRLTYKSDFTIVKVLIKEEL